MKQFVVLSLSVSLIALAMAGYSLLDPSRRPPAIPLAGLEARIDELRQQGDRLAEQLRAIEDEIAALSNRVLRPDAPPPVESGAAEAAAGAAEKNRRGSAEELVSRLEELAERLEEAAAGPRPLEASPPPGGRTETPEERVRIVAGAQAAALDRSRSAPGRLQALRDLRSRDGRSREVALAMIEAIRDPGLEPRLRADIIRNLSGLAHEELKQPLLEVLQTDPDPETREETIETLEVFYDDPAVHAAVLHAVGHDQAPSVRAEAMRRLAEFEARRAAVRR